MSPVNLNKPLRRSLIRMSAERREAGLDVNPTSLRWPPNMSLERRSLVAIRGRRQLRTGGWRRFSASVIVPQQCHSGELVKSALRGGAL